VCIVGDPDALPIGYWASKLNRAKLVYIPFEYFPFASYADDRCSKRWASREAHYANKCAAWVSLGDSLSEEYGNVYGIADRVHTCYSSWPRSAAPKSKRLRTKLSLGDDARIVIYQGRITKARGVYDVVEAMKYLPPEVHFVVLGMEENIEVRAHAKELNVDSNVHVLDAVPQQLMMEYTADADIGIIPIHNVCKSYWYCCPGKLFEFIAAGLPLAVSRLHQLERFVKRHDLGESFEPGSVEGIADALLKLLSDSTHRLRCAANAARLQQEEVCWEIQAEKLRRAVLGPSYAGNGLVSSFDSSENVGLMQ
jgi:glycosyltransferase involved in cell wall biosynthesis